MLHLCVSLIDQWSVLVIDWNNPHSSSMPSKVWFWNEMQKTVPREKAVVSVLKISAVGVSGVTGK